MARLFSYLSEFRSNVGVSPSIHDNQHERPRAPMERAQPHPITGNRRCSANRSNPDCIT